MFYYKFGLHPLRRCLLIRLSPCGCVWIDLLERALCLLLCSGGCWYVDPFSVLAVDSFASLEPFWILVDSHSSSFFVTWFRARTRVRCVASVMSASFVRIQ
jgi:hypothetical protein